MKPIRVQLKRTKGWRMPPNTVKVTRPGKWGNPFRIGGWFMVGDPDPRSRFKMSWCEAVEGYQNEKFTKIETASDAVDMFLALVASGYFKDFSELRGKNLACFCPIGSPCHADVLLNLANK